MIGMALYVCVQNWPRELAPIQQESKAFLGNAIKHFVIGSKIDRSESRAIRKA